MANIMASTGKATLIRSALIIFVKPLHSPVKPTPQEIIMIQIGETEAKAQFPALLEKVSRGEEVLITKRGKAVARLAPVAAARRRPTPEEMDKTLEEFRAFRKGLKLDGLDWKALRDEGRR